MLLAEDTTVVNHLGNTRKIKLVTQVMVFFKRNMLFHFYLKLLTWFDTLLFFFPR